MGEKEKEGIKYDKGKPLIGSMVLDFAPALLELCKVWEFGRQRYGESNWKDVEDGERRYTNALVRHLLDEANNEVDIDSGLRHSAHIAFNALARLYYQLVEARETEIEGGVTTSAVGYALSTLYK